MFEISNQRAIIDRRALMAELDALAARLSDPTNPGPELVDILKQHLQAGRDEIQRRFLGNSRGAQAGLTSAHEASFLVDQLLRGLFDFATQKAFPLGNPTVAEKLTLIAVGGYG